MDIYAESIGKDIHIIGVSVAPVKCVYCPVFSTFLHNMMLRRGQEFLVIKLDLQADCSSIYPNSDVTIFRFVYVHAYQRNLLN